VVVRKDVHRIRQRIKEAALALAGEMAVREVRIGLGYTAVLLENGQVGVAYTFPRDSNAGCSILGRLHPLAGRRASELIALFDSTDKIESAVALAASNALSNTMKDGMMQGDALQYVDIRPEDKVGMVGHFAPLVPLLRKKVFSLKIFEQVDQPTGDLLPQREAFKELPRCQVALITSTSILNHTIDDILDAAQSCRAVVLLGASTPLVRGAFIGTTVTLLSGVVVTRPGEILQIVGEGGGMRLFKNFIKKVNVLLK
jgi:uncharacterized protein (DUF4213/DUF364 family)